MQADADNDSSEEPTVDNVEHQADDALDERRNGVLCRTNGSGDHVGDSGEEADNQHDPQCNNQHAVDVARQPTEAARGSDAADCQQGAVECGQDCQFEDHQRQERSAEHQDDQSDVPATPCVPGLPQQCQEQESEDNADSDPEQELECFENVEHNC